MNKQIIHDALILTAFTLVLGLLLGLVYGITKPRIDAANEAAAQAAYKAVFEDAASFTATGYDEAEAIALMAEGGFEDTIDDVQVAMDASGNCIGYVITVTAKDASQGAITFSVGIRLDGTVNGYSITEIAETPGLGLKAKDEEFYSQFENKKVTEFVVVKSTPTADNEIETISGSTITSVAMANGCNAAIYYFNNKLGGAQ